MTYGDIHRGYRERVHYTEAPSHKKRVINLRWGRLARLKVTLRCRFDRNGLTNLPALYGFSLSVHPSVRLTITLVIHAKTVQHIEMIFAPYDRAMLDARSLCGSWASRTLWETIGGNTICYYLIGKWLEVRYLEYLYIGLWLGLLQHDKEQRALAQLL